MVGGGRGSESLLRVSTVLRLLLPIHSPDPGKQEGQMIRRRRIEFAPAALGAYRSVRWASCSDYEYILLSANTFSHLRVHSLTYESTDSTTY